MKRVALIPVLFLLWCAPARSTYVNSGKSDFANAASTACVPNGGGVTAGNYEVIGIQANGSSGAITVGITSPRVTTWVVDQNDDGTGDRRMLAHGLVTSSGAETITATRISGTGLTGSACGEYTSNFNVTTASPSSGSIQASTGSDVVTFISNPITDVSIGAPFTQRQFIQFGGTHFAVFGDLNAGSTAVYTATPAPPSAVYLVALCLGCGGVKHHAQVIRYKKSYPAPFPRDPLIFARAIATRKQLAAL